MIHKLKTDFHHADERGQICQILSIPNSQVNYLFTQKDAHRGCHYHKKNREYFYIICGKIEVSAFLVDDPDSKQKYIFTAGDLFVIEPYAMHSFAFLEDTQMIVIYDLGIESEDEKDIYRE